MREGLPPVSRRHALDTILSVAITGCRGTIFRLGRSNGNDERCVPFSSNWDVTTERSDRSERCRSTVVWPSGFDGASTRHWVVPAGGWNQE